MLRDNITENENIKSNSREIEKLKIKSDKKFFKVLKKYGINVHFKKQLKDDAIISITNIYNEFKKR